MTLQGADDFPRDKSVGDATNALMRAGLGMIPLAGAPAVELLNYLVAPPLEQRRNEWFQQIGEKLKELEEKQGIPLQSLRDNRTFIDTVMQATQVAIRTSQEEKKKALRNVVINSALPASPEITFQQLFISYIDVFTIWHIRLLDLFNNPALWATKRNHQFPKLMFGGLSDILESAFPELSGRRDLYDQIWKDLTAKGLVNTDSLHVTMSASGLMEKRTSGIGEQFIKFISEA